MQPTFRSALIVGATALFAVFSATQAAEPYSGGVNSLRSYLNENVNDFSRADGSRKYGDEVTSVRSLVRGIIKDVGTRRAKKK
jgi:hypothetical protein